jgi:nicotinamide phosphoribosyltransferase
MSFATKLSHVRYADGTVRDIMKKPKTDSEKISLPGILKVARDERGIPTVYPEEDTSVTGPNLLVNMIMLLFFVFLICLLFVSCKETIWDSGPVASHAWDDSFEVMRARVKTEWAALPPIHDPRSKSLHAKINKWIADFKKSTNEE